MQSGRTVNLSFGPGGAWLRENRKEPELDETNWFDAQRGSTQDAIAQTSITQRIGLSLCKSNTHNWSSQNPWKSVECNLTCAISDTFSAFQHSTLVPYSKHLIMSWIGGAIFQGEIQSNTEWSQDRLQVITESISTPALLHGTYITVEIWHFQCFHLRLSN